MSLLDLIRRRPQERKVISLADNYNFSYYGGYTQSKAMKLSTVYRCVEIISNSIAQLPLESFLVDKNGYKKRAKDHPSYYLLNKKPNKNMNRYTFIKLMVTNMLLNGNAYAYIRRNDRGDAVELIPLNPLLVEIQVTPDGLIYNTPLADKPIPDEDMIHILNFSYDGINGVSTIQHAADTLGLAYASEAQAKGFFKGGANLSGYLKIDGPLTPKQKEDNKRAWQQSFSPEVGEPGSVAVLEGNMSYTPVQVNPVDSQLLESREFNVIEICRFFGVSPVKCFDLSKSSYSTIEATQLAFLTDSLQPEIEKYELEFECKLFRPSERDIMDVRFDTAILLRTDKASLANYWSTLFNMGALQPNDIRLELDLPPIEGGDNAFLNLAMAPIKDIEEKARLEINTQQNNNNGIQDRPEQQ